MPLEQNVWSDINLIKVLQNSGVVVMPTDTIYGLMGQALSEKVVNRIYNIRKRNLDKPCIVLIGDIDELEKFSIILSEEQKSKIKEFWPISAIADIGQQKPVSIILDCPDEKFKYLHRGIKTLAFRLTKEKGLRDLLLKTGPLVAPSANPEGLPPAQNIEEAKKYFDNAVDLYIDGGIITSKASKLIQLQKDGSYVILRE